jgi:hypothetical protein
MTSPVTAGLLTGLGQGMTQVGTIMATDQLETKRQKMLAGLKADEAGKARTFQSDEKQKDRDLTVSEGDKDRASRESLQRIKEQAAQDKASAESGKPTTNWRKYEELKTKYLADNDGKLTKEADNHLLSLAYGADERINTKNNEVIFTGLLGDGSPGVTAEYGRPVDEQGNETGSRRDREFRTVPDPTAKESSAPAAPEGYAPVKLPQNMQGQKDGQYKLKDGRILIIQNGQSYIGN